MVACLSFGILLIEYLIKVLVFLEDNPGGFTWALSVYYSAFFDMHRVVMKVSNSPVSNIAILWYIFTDCVRKGLWIAESVFICLFYYVHCFTLSLIWTLLTGIGWRALVHPKTHPVSEYEFEVIIGGDGRRNTLEGNDVSIIHFKIQLILKLE